MFIENLKQSLYSLELIFSGIKWRKIFFEYGFDYIEIISLLIILIIAIESFLRFRKISRDISSKKSSDHVESLFEVVEKRKLFLLFYFSFVIIRISYMLFRFIFAVIYNQIALGRGSLDLGLPQDLFHGFVLNHTMPIFLEGIFLALAVIIYGILSYRSKKFTLK